MPEMPKKRVRKSALAKSARPKKTAAKSAPRVDAVADDAPAIAAMSPADEVQYRQEQKEAIGPGPAGAAHASGRDRYFEAVGRRKTAVARVRMFTKSGLFTVNDKPYGDYFPTLDLQKIVEDALKKMKLWERFRVSVKVSGGGIHAQAEAVRHGFARCLIIFNPDFRKRMKRAGFLTRDPRMKERKKFGLKKARRAPQWAKR